MPAVPRPLLDDAGRREYLATRDIRAEKIQDGIRLIIDGEEIEANPYEIALLNIVGTDVSRVMLETRIPNATEWQALLRGEMIPGAEETIRSYVTRRYESNGDETNE